jgi:hypothetical protein
MIFGIFLFPIAFVRGSSDRRDEQLDTVDAIAEMYIGDRFYPSSIVYNRLDEVHVNGRWVWGTLGSEFLNLYDSVLDVCVNTYAMQRIGGAIFRPIHILEALNTMAVTGLASLAQLPQESTANIVFADLYEITRTLVGTRASEIRNYILTMSLWVTNLSLFSSDASIKTQEGLMMIREKLIDVAGSVSASSCDNSPRKGEKAVAFALASIVLLDAIMEEGSYNDVAGIDFSSFFDAVIENLDTIIVSI